MYTGKMALETTCMYVCGDVTNQKWLLSGHKKTRLISSCLDVIEVSTQFLTVLGLLLLRTSMALITDN